LRRDSGVKFISQSPEETQQIAAQLARQLQGGEVLLLEGPLGVGKTVFAKAIAAAIGVTEIVTSPTFTLVAEYEGKLRFVHVDLYRISSAEECEQLALDEMMNQQTVMAVEWPENAGTAIPNGITVQIRVLESGGREIVLPDGFAFDRGRKP
jgi:ATPase, YjeE family